MSQSELVYRIYIRSTQERLWEALYKPEHTSRYWGVEFASDWAEGSPITWSYVGVTIEDPESVVIAFEPPHHLSYKWHMTTPELARAVGMSEEMRRRLDSELRSTADFRLEPSKDMIKLTLRQSGFGSGRAKLESLTESWPRIMSQLKTYLECESA